MTTYTITEADLTACLNQRLPDVAHTLLSSLTPNSGEMAAPSTSQPFGWTKQSEIDSSRQYGGSVNVWMQKYDCDTPLYATSVAESSTSPLTDEQIDEMTTLQWGVQKVAAMYHAHRAYARAIEAKIKGGA